MKTAKTTPSPNAGLDPAACRSTALMPGKYFTTVLYKLLEGSWEEDAVLRRVLAFDENNNVPGVEGEGVSGLVFPIAEYVYDGGGKDESGR